MPMPILEEGRGGGGGGGGFGSKETESIDVVNPVNNGKPPRHVPLIRHPGSTARLGGSAELVCCFL